MYSVYILKNPSNKTYVGQTNDIERRLAEHNSGIGAKYTKARGPWSIIYTKKFSSRSDAMMYEKYLKTGKGREYIKSLVNN